MAPIEDIFTRPGTWMAPTAGVVSLRPSQDIRDLTFLEAIPESFQKGVMYSYCSAPAE